MRAVLLTKHGGPEVLRITEVPVPQPRHGEVRVRIRVIGLNFAEVLSRRGMYTWAPKLPYILGMEAFGEIDAIGEGVKGRKVGDPVIVGAQFGTYAEFICVPAERALTPPRGFSAEQNAAFAVAYLTAWVGLMEMARLRPTDIVLVTSAAGGVGSAAVQIAKKFGARVIGAAGPGKQDAVRALGADEALNYDEAGWDANIAPTVVLELTGGHVFRSAIRRIAPLGRIVVGGASGAFPRNRNPIAVLRALRNMPRLKLNDMLRRSYGVLSFHVGWLLDAGTYGAQWDALTSFVAGHRIEPLVGPRFSFDQIAEAQQALENRNNIGKVLVHMGKAEGP